MVKRIGGNRRKTRTLLKKPVRSRGKISTTNYFQEFNEGDKVVMKAEPSVQEGMHFRRFQGKTGIIKKRTRNCYEVSVMDGNKAKLLVVHPVHLRRA